MIWLGNDYSFGAHPKVLQHLVDINDAGEAGYGDDSVSRQARKIVLNECGLKEGEVYFLTGGTQTNIVALDWLLRQGEGILCTETAHINVHEAGAIESTGHKIIPLKSDFGKLYAKSIEEYMEIFFSDPTWPHMVVPGGVYISHPTEIGTLYTLQELEALRRVCDKYRLRLYVDGARLGYALGSEENDVSLKDISRLSDGFYIGGTKCGSLFGEALVFPCQFEPLDQKRLFGLVKRHGALFAKGWLIASQFEILFKDRLYYEIGRDAVRKGLYLRDALKSIGIETAWNSPTNQQFYLVPTALLKSLSEEIVYDLWGSPGPQESTIRLVTTWHTSQQELEIGVDFIRKLMLSRKNLMR